MTRTKLGLLGLCAVLVGIMSMSAGTAQGALSWLILESGEKTATELKAEVGTEVDGVLILHARLIGIPFLLTCKNLATKGVFLEAGGTLNKGGKVTFTECGEVTETGTGKKLECTVKSPGAETGTIESGGGKGGLVLTEGEVVTKIEPEAGPEGTFATIRFEGAGCVLPESSVVHGSIVLQDCLHLVLTHEIRHLVTVSIPLSALYLGKHSAEQLEATKLLVSFWVRLLGSHAGLKWAAMDV